MKRTKIFKRVLLIVLSIIFIALAGFVIWASFPAKADASALAALQSDANVSVSMEKSWIEFSASQESTRSGLIFYPGGRVDYRAYAPLLREIAAAGNTVYLVKMPLNLAVFGVNRAAEIINSTPELATWYIGGHSLGGAMASAFAYNNPDLIEGLILWASYPAESNDLSQSGLPVLSISASRDGLTTNEKVNETKTLLPSDTLLFKIEGGNHAQFGSYGEQAGDLPATITAEEQHRQIINATLLFMMGIR